MVNGLNQYRTYQVQTITPEDQVAMLYEAAQRFIEKAALALKEGRYVEVSENVGKAQRIFSELRAALNPEAGEITRNLNSLYDYWTWRLTQGLIRKDIEAFREVSATVGDLAGTWREAARQVRVQRGTSVSG